MSWERLGKFLDGVVAASELYSKAAQNGYFVETVCICANLIDAKLRIGIILARQLKRNDKSIDEELLLQKEGVKPIPEKGIYKTAREESVISKDLEKILRKLYDERNRVVHRYIISDLTTEETLSIAMGYEKVLQQVRDAIWRQERKQIEMGVGMTVEGPDFKGPEAEAWLDEMKSRKHGSSWLSDAIQRK